MKGVMFNIIKLLVSVVFQNSICFGSVLFAAYAMHYICDSEIFYWVIIITIFFVGEAGVFLLYTVNTLEKMIPRIIYAIIYMGIHLTCIAAFSAYIFIYLYYEVIIFNLA